MGVLTNLGFAYFDLGETEAAARLFRSALSVGPREANAHFGLARTLERLGQRKEAVRSFQAYLECAPADDPFRLAAQERLRRLQDER